MISIIRYKRVIILISNFLLFVQLFLILEN